MSAHEGRKQVDVERDAERWSFFREHAYDDMDGLRVHAWLVHNHFREGGWDKAIDRLMRIRMEALAAQLEAIVGGGK